MLMPSVFGRDIFDDFMDGFAFPDVNKELYGKHAKNIMKTDVNAWQYQGRGWIRGDR